MSICKVLCGGNLLHCIITWYQPDPRGYLQMADSPSFTPAAEASALPVLFQWNRWGGLWDICMVLSVMWHFTSLNERIILLSLQNLIFEVCLFLFDLHYFFFHLQWDHGAERSTEEGAVGRKAEQVLIPTLLSSLCIFYGQVISLVALLQKVRGILSF